MADKEQPKEKPQIDGSPQEEPREAMGQEDVQALLKELETIGVDSPEKLQNMATASSQTGRLARELGELRQQNAEMANMLQQLQTQNHQPAQPQYNEYGEAQGPDLQKIVEGSIRNFYMNEILKPQQEAQKKVFGELSEIQNDPDYGLVQKTWNEHWNSPQTQQRVYSGQSSPRFEYDRLVRTYYREALKRSHGALKGLVDQGAKPSTPHVEQGEQQHVHTPTSDDEMKEQIDRLQKNWKGEDDDVEKLVATMFPQGDPFITE